MLIQICSGFLLVTVFCLGGLGCRDGSGVGFVCFWGDFLFPEAQDQYLTIELQM